MSLLTSLIQASARFQQAMDNRQAPAAKPNDGQTAEAKIPEAAGSPGDDRFTPSGQPEGDSGSLKTRQLPLGQYKQTVAQDLSFVRETLRHKLAEYNLHPATALSVGKGEGSSAVVEGKIPDELRDKIEKDLNNNRGFRDAFSRLSVTEPTLHFMDNALKLNQAYGVSNSLLDSLVSENQQFNGLQDVIHRYDSLKRSAGTSQPESINSPRYAFSLNARA
ncbi:hypothetical protein [Marinobacter halophilus]|uniref:Uncharacterized protein n=1 Tax=Marinobacter halophilus TaxID=1323740 RepID=A0A2T1KBX4_9GAMM|nr:hypothetical protein [Marinobacter halophilus]PSF07629.1 hypothetical protein C7H08_12085 [Marinobacter halophilus]GGC56174.1 hypothetical protein GCM10011362_00560 [Marinobacter halophilus]